MSSKTEKSSRDKPVTMRPSLVGDRDLQHLEIDAASKRLRGNHADARNGRRRGQQTECRERDLPANAQGHHIRCFKSRRVTIFLGPVSYAK